MDLPTAIDPRLDWQHPVCFMCGKAIARRANLGMVDCDAGPAMCAHLTCLDNKPAFDVYVAWKKAVDAAMLGKAEADKPLGQVFVSGTFQ